MGANHAWVAPGQLIGDWLSAQAHLPQYLEARARVAGAARRVASLSELCSRITQGPNPQYTSNDYPCVITRNVTSDQLQMSGSNWVSAEEFSRLQRFKLQRGDILVTLKGAGSTGKACVFDTDVEAIHSREVGVVRVSDSMLNPRFLCAYFQGRFGRLLFDQGTTGSTGQLTLSTTYLKSFPVPLPDRRIQDYIGAKVELAERCRAAAEDHWQKAVGLFQSLFTWSAPPQFSLTSVPAVAELSGRLDPKYYRREYLDAVREIMACEHGWEPIGDLVAEVSNGVEYRQFCSDGVPYLTVTNVGDGDLDTDGAPRIPVDAPISDRGRIAESDVLVVRTGSIGQAAVVQRDAANAIISSHFIRLRLHKGDLGQGAWLAFFLNTELGKALQFRIAYGAVQPQIGQDELLRLPVPRLKAEVRRALVRGFLSRSALRAHARQLVNEAKADVEALIEGTLDVQAILSGTVKAPTADDIPELVEDGA
ncbi:restriction endonuclease subunit S [Streptomyces tibetensis]|uniref:restriction endonuclease subunit S n=1 Tax=Streptomyces tibetensis TaxID=2382123 RepID=UPI00381C2AF3